MPASKMKMTPHTFPFHLCKGFPFPQASSSHLPLNSASPISFHRSGQKPLMQNDSDFSEEEQDVPIVAKLPTPAPPKSSGDSGGDLRSRDSADPRVRIADLEAKNAELREEAQRHRSRAEGAEKRAAAVERKFEAFREKERKDTAALEKMVQDIEQNLKISTTRALGAEANASRLQQELNKALGELQAERLTRAGGPTPADFGPYAADNVADIHSRVNQVSLELQALSENARNALQMLLGNTQTLERCSLTLKNLDKITELGTGGSKERR